MFEDLLGSFGSAKWIWENKEGLAVVTWLFLALARAAAELTPSTKDDAIISKAASYVGTVFGILRFKKMTVEVKEKE